MRTQDGADTARANNMKKPSAVRTIGARVFEICGHIKCNLVARFKEMASARVGPCILGTGGQLLERDLAVSKILYARHRLETWSISRGRGSRLLVLGSRVRTQGKKVLKICWLRAKARRASP